MEADKINTVVNDVCAWLKVWPETEQPLIDDYLDDWHNDLENYAIKTECYVGLNIDQRLGQYYSKDPNQVRAWLRHQLEDLAPMCHLNVVANSGVKKMKLIPTLVPIINSTGPGVDWRYLPIDTLPESTFELRKAAALKLAPDLELDPSEAVQDGWGAELVFEARH